MSTTLLIHIVAGTFGLVSGFIALFATKGATLHRRSGLVFVCVMLTMSLSGMVIAAARGVAPAINIPSALLTACLVVSALTTVRPVAAGSRWLDIATMMVALAVGLASLGFGFEALANGGKRNGMPAFPFFMFGVVGLIAAFGDVRVLRSGRLQGASRLARHLWRMCFALFLAAMAFFLGQADEFPKVLRIPALLALPVLTVLVTMFYWLWRVRVRKTFHGNVGASTPDALRASV